MSRGVGHHTRKIERYLNMETTGLDLTIYLFSSPSMCSYCHCKRYNTRTNINQHSHNNTDRRINTWLTFRGLISLLRGFLPSFSHSAIKLILLNHKNFQALPAHSSTLETLEIKNYRDKYSQPLGERPHSWTEPWHCACECLESFLALNEATSFKFQWVTI